MLRAHRERVSAKGTASCAGALDLIKRGREEQFDVLRMAQISVPVPPLLLVAPRVVVVSAAVDNSSRWGDHPQGGKYWMVDEIIELNALITS